MKIIEMNGDLFDMSNYGDDADNVVLAHCIASDFGMGGGIALQFIQHYDMKNRLIRRYPVDTQEGLCRTPRPSLVGTAVKVGNVYNLITKKFTFEKPQYYDFINSIVDMRNQMVSFGDTALAIPYLIGCGIDGLDETTVMGIIDDTFSITDITIYVVRRI